MERYDNPFDQHRPGYDVLVFADNELARRGLSDMLTSLATVKEVNSFEIPHSASVYCGRSFDLLVIASDDLASKGLNQLAQAALSEDTKVLLLMGRSSENLDAVTRFPCNGYLIQDDVTEETLAQAINRIVLGEVPMPAVLANRLLERARGVTTQERPHCPKLTPRERETLVLLAEGLSNKQIARRMLISQHGVKRLVANVLSKLNCSNRTLAAAVAIKHGLLEEI
ncbi:response regulator transcription factor [Micromonospora mirobrigensis]|uniref:DNA-binding response regulator, NarL/FixJ family, contains REC and HTH domains n=1 Tax=Micromonospora mirobrigensis TaxID=262898 RepID=A0A1C4V278_9ACTN|nr:response regulator transcription factor [Micromonospora mirobrigensis]SCE78082.1 DNA-binding response regulator, NarL/FixJ family, contains REC and HTH domains [Micromonospora mirobrigensis]